MTRGTGKTRDMVLSLPADGPAIACVHSGLMQRYVEAMIRDLRGPEIAKRIKVYAILNPNDVDRAIRGTTGPVFIDHWLEERPDSSRGEERTMNYLYRAAWDRIEQGREFRRQLDRD